MSGTSNAAFDSLRKFMLDADAHNRWHTLSEIVHGLRKTYGLRCLQGETMNLLRELGKDGVHTLASRRRVDDQQFFEYRVYVRQPLKEDI